MGKQRAEPHAERVAEPPSRAALPGGAALPRLTADTARALQRAAGNRAVSTLVSREPAPTAPSAPKPPELTWNPLGWVFGFLPRPEFSMRPPAPVMPTDPVEVAVIELWSALQPLGRGSAAGSPLGAVASQVVRPQTTKPKWGAGKDLPDAVFGTTVVKALLALGPAGTKEEKAQRAGKESAVLQRVFALAGSARDKKLPAPANPPAQTLDAEWNSLGDVQRFFTGKEGYLAARPSILLAFGALDVATSRAVDRLRRFFGEMVQQEFCGTVYTVHPVMASRLRRAAEKLGPNPPQVEGVPLQQVRASHRRPALPLQAQLRPGDRPAGDAQPEHPELRRLQPPDPDRDRDRDDGGDAGHQARGRQPDVAGERGQAAAPDHGRGARGGHPPAEGERRIQGRLRG